MQWAPTLVDSLVAGPDPAFLPLTNRIEPPVLLCGPRPVHAAGGRCTRGMPMQFVLPRPQPVAAPGPPPPHIVWHPSPRPLQHPHSRHQQQPSAITHTVHNKSTLVVPQHALGSQAHRPSPVVEAYGHLVTAQAMLPGGVAVSASASDATNGVAAVAIDPTAVPLGALSILAINLNVLRAATIAAAS